MFVLSYQSSIMSIVCRVVVHALVVIGTSVATRDITSLGHEYMLIPDKIRETIFASNISNVEFIELPISDIGPVWALDYDPIQQLVFWTTRGRPGSIRSAHIDGSNYRVIVSSDINNPYGLAVDPERSMIYWSDDNLNTLESVRYNGTDRTLIKSFGSRSPLGLVIHFPNRKLYWGAGEIQRISMDRMDEEPETLVDTNLHKADNMAFNYQGTRLYWIDDSSNRVESIGLSGEDRQLLSDRSTGYEGIYWHNHELYITDYGADEVVIMDARTGSVRSVETGDFDGPYDIYIVSSRQDPLNWTCSFNVFRDNLCGWKQSYQDDFDWSWLPRVPTDQNSSDKAMFVDGRTRPAGATAVLVSPFSTANEDVATCLTFFYKMTPTSSQSTLNVHFSVNGITRRVWSLSGYQGTRWRRAVLDIPDGDRGYFHFETVVGQHETSVIGVDDVRFGSCEYQTTFEEDISVICHGNLTVLVGKNMVTATSPNDLRFWNSSCHGYDYSTDYFAISTPFEGCGTKMTADDDNFYFSNKIENLDSGPGHDIIVNCTVTRRNLVRSFYRTRSSLVVYSEVHGNFTIALKRYTGSTFDRPVEDSDIADSQRQRTTIYLATTIASVTNLYILNERCWATPSIGHDASPSEDLIIDGVSSSSYANTYDLNNSSVQAFSVQAFRVHTSSDVTYIHCNVLVCAHSDSLDSCQRAESHSRSRMRRDSLVYQESATGRYTISQGPFVLQRGNWEIWTTLVYVVSIMSVVLALLLIAVIYLYHQSTRRERTFRDGR